MRREDASAFLGKIFGGRRSSGEGEIVEMLSPNAPIKIETQTFGFVPLRTEFRSLSSISFARIFFTCSMSFVSGTYFRLVGDEGVWGSSEEEAGGEPGGVVESTVPR